MRLIQLQGGEVGRRQPLVFGLAAVLDDLSQLVDEGLGQAADGLGLELMPAEAPAEAEHALEHLAVEGQPVAQAGLLALIGATGMGTGAEQVVAGVQAAVELAQVVEGDARQWPGQALAGLVAAQVAQGTEAQAIVRQTAQLFLDLLDRLGQVWAGAQAQRIDAGEPANRAGQV
ncbi:hypothetical protein D3C81_843250 [compost metagenome]